MDRFTKLVLEQYKEQAKKWKAGTYGTIRSTEQQSSSAFSLAPSLEKIYDQDYQFVMIMGKNYSPMKLQEVLKKLTIGKYWGTDQSYVHVVMPPQIWSGGNNNQLISSSSKRSNKSYITYPVVRFPLNDSKFKSLDLDSNQSSELRKVGKSYAMSLSKYKELNNKKDPEYEKRKQQQINYQAITTDENPELKSRLKIDETDPVLIDYAIKNRAFFHLYNIFKNDAESDDFAALKNREYQMLRKSKDERKIYLQQNPKYIEIMGIHRGNAAADKLKKLIENSISENYFKNIGLNKSFKDIIKDFLK